MAKTSAKRRGNHTFNMTPQAKIPRSSFNRSHTLKTTFDAGHLIPIFVDEVLPGDTHVLRASFFGRLATPLKPIMDNLFLESFFFFVPNRLLWDNWKKFNGEQDAPGDSTDFTIPKCVVAPGGHANGTIFDYFGIPTKVPGFEHNALPLRAYALIWNEWFRDQNLQQPLPFNTGNGPDTYSDYGLRRRGKRHDYFTAALPWPQKGDPVTVPLGLQAPISYESIGTGVPSLLINAPGTGNRETMIASNPSLEINPGGDAVNGQVMFADLANATGFTINQLRESFQIQKLLERDARGGTRYTEIVRSHFGVISPDARLQRPEFLGGGTSMVNINPVPQTSASQTQTEPSPQGNLSAFGTVSANGHGFTKSFTEHGYIIGLINVRADLTYQQGLNRIWSREGRYDFYWPALAGLGEQAILNKEIYTQGTEDDDKVFGYIPRYDEYRYKPSQITGKFRSNDDGSLDVWHLAQEFSTLPVLGDTFIADQPPINRVIAVNTEPHFLLDAYFRLRSVRPMPMYGVPGLIDHF